MSNFRLFLSGVEPNAHWEVCRKYHKNVLLSYKYLMSRGVDVDSRFKDVPPHSIFLDSGCYTYQHEEKYDNKSVEFWDNLVNEYYNFILEHQESLACCVEFDLQNRVGIDKVMEWREKYFTNTPIPCVFVWHTEDGIDNWRKMCQTYDYVGYSNNEVKDEEIVSALFNIAQQYKTKVHVFASSGNFPLLSYPAYSADSTTYLSGSQYGELNFFEGGKIKRLRKNVWKTQYIPRLIALGCDKEALEREAPYELLKASVLSYVKLEEFIIQRFSNRKYWETREEIDQMDFTSLLPPKEWFEGDMEDWQYWAIKMHIDPNVEETQGKNLICDCYSFVTDNSAIENYSMSVLFELCNLFGDKESNTQIKCVVALKKYFIENLLGQRDDLMRLTVSKDIVKDEPKERTEFEKVIESEEKEVSKEEIKSFLSNLLTSGVEDETDKALIEAGITPIYDDEGNIKAGLKRMRKRKKITNHIPTLNCATCFNSGTCEHYQNGALCYYKDSLKQFDTRDPEDAKDALAEIANIAMERLSTAYLSERLNGGMPQKEVTKLMTDAFNYVAKLKEIEDSTKAIVAERKTVVLPNGKTEVRESLQANPTSNGILSSLLSK